MARAARRPAPLPGSRLRILHLAFEDHRRPGSGGGGVRTHEIDRRLAAAGHQVTVVTTNYPGATRRVEEGVTYRPLGLPWGYVTSIVSYHLCTPLVVLFTRADLVVEDFAAPMSSVLVPLWTRRPTVAVVQWLFASQTSERYRVPFWLPERLGLRLHRRFVAVSEYMAEAIKATNPRALTHVVGGGVTNPTGAGGSEDRRAGVVYLGRLQSRAKGLDLLFSAVARLTDAHPDVVVNVAGDGPARQELADLAATLGLGERVRFIDRVEGDAKWDLLRQAAVVVVPSRFESFGLVILEAFSAGTPVVAFDLPAIRELVTPECGILVEPFDVTALADSLHRLLADPHLAARMGRAAGARAQLFTWEAAAAAQEQAYLEAVATHRPRRRASGGRRRSPR